MSFFMEFLSGVVTDDGSPGGLSLPFVGEHRFGCTIGGTFRGRFGVPGAERATLRFAMVTAVPAIHLVRHAKAGKRSEHPDDILRPLDDRGREQADRIAERLASRPVERLLSSPATRCVQTLEPLATRVRQSIEIVDDLWEGQAAQPVVSLIHRIASAGGGAVLSSHGDIIPDVLGSLAASGVPLMGDGCAKGSIWELRIEGGRIVEGAYLGRA